MSGKEQERMYGSTVILVGFTNKNSDFKGIRFARGDANKDL